MVELVLRGIFVIRLFPRRVEVVTFVVLRDAGEDDLLVSRVNGSISRTNT